MDKDLKTALTCKKFKSHIKGDDPADFPDIPPMIGPDDGWLKLPLARFRQMVKQVSYAASEDESRPALTGVCIEWEGMDTSGTLKFVTTDGYRLAIVTEFSAGHRGSDPVEHSVAGILPG